MADLALYPVDEVQRLYATIADLRERLAAAGDGATLGAADVVLLRSLGSREMTRRELAKDTGMSAEYLHVRLYRLRAAGKIEQSGRKPRIGKGQGEWVWRKTPNVEVSGTRSVSASPPS
jgi:CRP-like cAMP-binding protein